MICEFSPGSHLSRSFESKFIMAVHREIKNKKKCYFKKKLITRCSVEKRIVSKVDFILGYFFFPFFWQNILFLSLSAFSIVRSKSENYLRWGNLTKIILGLWKGRRKNGLSARLAGDLQWKNLLSRETPARTSVLQPGCRGGLSWIFWTHLQDSGTARFGICAVLAWDYGYASRENHV